MIFESVSPDANGQLIISLGSADAVSAGAIVIEPNPAESIALTEVSAGDTALSSSGSFRVNDPDQTDIVTASHSVSVSGTADRSDTTAPTDQDLEDMFEVTPATVLDNTSTTNILNWSFNSEAADFDFLETGETIVLTYTVTATDDNGATGVSETVTITITGTNETPQVTAGGDATAGVTETDTTLTVSDSITVSDKDTKDTVTVAISDVQLSGSFIDGSSTLPAALSANNHAELLGMLSLTPEAGTALAANEAEGGTSFDWTFTSGDSGDAAFDFLQEDETLTLTYTLTLSDNSGAGISEATATTTTDVAVTITGTNDSPVISYGVDGASGSAVETNATITDSGALDVVAVASETPAPLLSLRVRV